jgi:hypothetical protein
VVSNLKERATDVNAYIWDEVISTVQASDALGKDPAIWAYMKAVPPRAILKLLDIHRPHKIYDECLHKDGEVHTLVELDDMTTCEESLMYEVCHNCCLDSGGYHTEECASGHDHAPDKPLCPTLAALAYAPT